MEKEENQKLVRLELKSQGLKSGDKLTKIEIVQFFEKLKIKYGYTDATEFAVDALGATKFRIAKTKVNEPLEKFLEAKSPEDNKQELEKSKLLEYRAGDWVTLSEIKELIQKIGAKLGYTNSQVFARHVLGITFSAYEKLERAEHKETTIFLDEQDQQVVREKRKREAIEKKEEAKQKKAREREKKEEDKKKAWEELKTLGYRAGDWVTLPEIERLAQEIGAKFGYADPKEFAKHILGIDFSSYKKLEKEEINRSTIFLDEQDRKGVIRRKKQEEREKKETAEQGKVTEREITRKKKEEGKKKAWEELKSSGYRAGDWVTLPEIERLAQEIGAMYGYTNPMRFAIHILDIHRQAYIQLEDGRSKRVKIFLDDRVFKKDLIKQFKKDAECKNRHFSKKEVDIICEENGITLEFFIKYLANAGHTKWLIKEYEKALDNNTNGIWIGDKHPLSKEYVESNIQILMEVSRNTSISFCQSFCRPDLSDEYEDVVFSYILNNCGDIEKNFAYEGNEQSLEKYFIGSAKGYLRWKYIKEQRIEVSTGSFYVSRKDTNEYMDYNSIEPSVEYRTNEGEWLTQGMHGESSDLDEILRLMHDATENHGVDSREALIEFIASNMDNEPDKIMSYIEQIGKMMIKKGIVKTTEKGIILGDII